MDGDGAPRRCGGATLPQHAAAAVGTEVGFAATVGAVTDGHDVAGRAGDGVSLKIDGEVVLSEPPLAVRRRRHLSHHVVTLPVEMGERVSPGVGRVGEHYRLVLVAIVTSEQVVDRVSVMGVSRGDHHLVDHLGVRVHRQVRLQCRASSNAA